MEYRDHTRLGRYPLLEPARLWSQLYDAVSFNTLNISSWFTQLPPRSNPTSRPCRSVDQGHMGRDRDDVMAIDRYKLGKCSTEWNTTNDGEPR